MTLVLFTVLTGVSAAASPSITVNQTRDTVTPGINQTLASLTIIAPGNDTRILDTTHNFPFPARLHNVTWNVTDSITNNSTTYNTTITADLVIAPGGDAEPSNRTSAFHLIFPDESRQLTFPYRVDEIRNWTVAPLNVSQNISVGSSGLFAEFTVAQHGNADQTVTTNLTGNLSQYLKVEPEFTIHPDTPHTARVTYQVRRVVPFGNYSGGLVFRSGNEVRQVNLSATFYDEIRPTIHDVDVPRTVMATTEPDWMAAIADNLDVAEVVANVTRQTTVHRNNTTRQVNRSVTEVVFSHVANTDRWEATFTETADRGRYYMNVTATDTAGNQVSTLRSFTVERLRSLDVQETSFEFDSVRPDRLLTQEIFEITTATPVEVTLTSFTEFQTNDSMAPGIRKVGEASSDTLDEVGDSVTVSEPGTYELVVETGEKGRFKGKLNYSTVPQHVAVPATTFRGQFIDPACPQESTFRSGNYTYEFGYSNGGCVSGRAELVVSLPGEKCQGYSDVETCINVRGLDFGRIESLESEADRAWLVAMGLAVLVVLIAVVAGGAWVFERRIWPYTDFELAKEVE